MELEPSAFQVDGNGLGWLIDDIEFMYLLAYNGEVCVTSAQGDLECAGLGQQQNHFAG